MQFMFESADWVKQTLSLLRAGLGQCPEGLDPTPGLRRTESTHSDWLRAQTQ